MGRKKTKNYYWTEDTEQAIIKYNGGELLKCGEYLVDSFTTPHGIYFCKMRLNVNVVKYLNLNVELFDIKSLFVLFVHSLLRCFH